MVTATPPILYPPEVLLLAQRLGGASALDTFEQLARHHFPYASVGEFERMDDPDSGEEWITLSLRVPGPVRRFLEDETAFTAAWHSSLGEEHWKLFTLLPDFE